MTRNSRILAASAAAAVALAVIVIALGGWQDDATGPAASHDPSPSQEPQEPVAAPTPPTAAVDYFQLGPDGVATVAGRTQPGARVRLLLDGRELDSLTADATGSFASFPQIAATDRTRALTIEVDGDATGSDTILVQAGRGAAARVGLSASATGTDPDRASVAADLASVEGAASPPDGVATSPPAQPATVDDPLNIPPDIGLSASTGLRAASDAGQDAAARRLGDPASTRAASSDGPSSPAPIAAPDLIVSANGVRTAGSSRPIATVALDAISYDDSGEVRLTGRGPGTGILRIYIDNRPVSETPLPPGGDWQAALPEVDPGTYTLRIDQIGLDGSVQSRIATPFLKEDPAQVRALRTGDGPVQRIDTRTVQPGNTLWAFATDQFADGMMYVAIYQANADQIRDPDLIYPGQVFRLPDTQASGNPAPSP